MENKNLITTSCIRGENLEAGDVFYTHFKGKKMWMTMQRVKDDPIGYGVAILIDPKDKDNLYFQKDDIFIITNIEL